MKSIKLLYVLLIAFLATASVSVSADTLKLGVTIRMISDAGFKIGQMIEDEFKAINDAGGINGRDIELVFLNDECKSEKGVANANKLIYQHKVLAVIGSSCSSVTSSHSGCNRKSRGAADYAAFH